MDFENKDKEQILKDAGKRGVVLKADNSGGAIEAHEYEKLAITVKCTQDLEKALAKLVAQIRENSESNDRLAKKIYFLNWVLAGATVIIALSAIISLFATAN